MNETPSTAVRSMPCWASLPWRDGPPKRRGWWAIEWANGEIGIHRVVRYANRWQANITPGYMGQWCNCEDYNVKRSAGPLVERDGAWHVETTPNERS